MYATQNDKSNSSIPVKNFDPGPGLNEFARRNEIENSTNHCKCSDSQENEQPKCCEQSIAHPHQNEQCSCVQTKACSQKKGLFGLHTDDLLLIFIIILLLSDNEQENDKLIPIVLGALLLF